MSLSKCSRYNQLNHNNIAHFLKKFLTLIIFSGFLSGCSSTTSAKATIDVNSIRTAAAKTVIAEFTQTARVTPATPTTTETITVTSISIIQSAEAVATQTFNPLESTPTEITCADAIWVADITVADGTEMTPGQDFVKTWKIFT